VDLVGAPPLPHLAKVAPEGQNSLELRHVFVVDADEAFDERLYYPIEVEPYTPAHHFEGGKANPEFRTKPQIALELVEWAAQMGLPFRAVVGDILYGEHRKFKEGLEDKGIPYILSLKPSHAWWHPMEEVGWVEGVAQAAYWNGPDDPGEWRKLERRFHDGHTEVWWALEAECRAFGPEKPKRLVVASTDPAALPSLTSWYLATNLPAPGSKRAEESALMPADLAEVVRLYALRNWVEQSYKQVKNSLGWAHYQVRRDISIRRHWQMVCCAFTFCWWESVGFLEDETSPGVILSPRATIPSAKSQTAGGGKRSVTRPKPPSLSWPLALRRVRAWLEPYVMLMRYWRAFSDLPPPPEPKALLEWVFSGQGLYLYAR
jgi:hypothetical protein